jgi:ribosomal protein S14
MVKSKIIKQFNYPHKLSKSVQLRMQFFPILKNKSLDVSFRSIIYSYIHKKIRFYNSRYKIGCFVTGRSRGVLAKFHISRLTFKKYAMEGELTGIFKIRW